MKPPRADPSTAVSAAAAGRGETRSSRAAVDLASLMKVKSLELRAKVLVEGLWRGLHRSPTHGFSVEFTEYRPYSPGDDVRFIDWRLYARTDRDYVKRYEDETNLGCQLVVDQSRSISFSGTPAGAEPTISKADWAATFAATLASFLFSQGDAVGVTTFAGALGAHVPARNRPGHLRRLLHALERPADGRSTEVGAALDGVAPLLRRRGMLVVLSDFLAPIESCERQLATLRAAGHEIVVVQILDRMELTFALPGPLRLRDLESDAIRDTDPAVAAAPYRAALEAHLAALRGLCDRLGLFYLPVTTDEPLTPALLALIARRPGSTAGARPARMAPRGSVAGRAPGGAR